ncbi:hypothetical protein [Methanocella conradii]|nr:hypothetical protein [Methanocella conradii]MDI6897627.1 hypothetical protein [Methanocella conradii]
MFRLICFEPMDVTNLPDEADEPLYEATTSVSIPVLSVRIK